MEQTNRFETWAPRLGDDLRDLRNAIRADNRDLTRKHLKRIARNGGFSPDEWLRQLGARPADDVCPWSLSRLESEGAQ